MTSNRTDGVTVRATAPIRLRRRNILRSEIEVRICRYAQRARRQSWHLRILFLFLTHE